ncbi:MAG: ArsC/Spx/MgsR family protein, partial [Maribacter sp.]
EVINCLGIKPESLVRKNEVIWKENYRHRLLSDEEVLDAMILHPKLIERPIVISNGTAVIGRPLANIEDFIS